MTPTKKRLGELLIEAGVIDEHQLLAALGHQKQWGVKLGQALVDLKIATELQIVDALSKKLGYEAVRLDRVEASSGSEAALKLVPRELARAQNILPLAVDGHSLTIAMSDPTNVALVDELAFRTGKRVRICIAGDREIARSIRKVYFPEELLRAAAIDLTFDSVEPVEATADWFTSLKPGARQDYLGERQLELDADTVVTMAARPTPTPPPVPQSSAPKSVGAPVANEVALVDAINRMLRGEKAPGGLEPGRLVAATVRVLLRKGLVSEAELLAELMKK